MTPLTSKARRTVARTTAILEGILSASNAVRPSIAQRAANPELAAARDRLDALIAAARAWDDAAGDLLLAVDGDGHSKGPASDEEIARAKEAETSAANAYREIADNL